MLARSAKLQDLMSDMEAELEKKKAPGDLTARAKKSLDFLFNANRQTELAPTQEPAGDVLGRPDTLCTRYFS